VDGHAGSRDALTTRVASHRCVGALKPGCEARTPVRLTIVRDGRTLTESVTPRYDPRAKKMRIGFTSQENTRDASVGDAVGQSLDQMWTVTTTSVDRIVGIFDAQKRKEIGSAVGAYEVTRETIENDITQAIGIIALISLSLAIINLYPFLPLDGGHIFWAIVEKIRRRPVPFSTMERASILGFGLVLMFFFIGLSNDIGRLTGEGFQTR
jgi:regulator of sigma E protease